ncbi:MAG: hypothetical protein AB8F74_01330 [Saprospiraceae bacterium]
MTCSKLQLFNLVLLFFYYLPNVSSQGCCSGGTPISNHLNLNGSEKGKLFLRLNYDYNYLDDLIHKGDKIPNEDRNRITHSVLARVDYSISDRINIGALIPWTKQIENIPQNNFPDRTTQGLGDITLLGQVAILKKTRNQLFLATGVKFPNGKTDRVDEFSNLNFHPDLQPGSGTWDIMSILQFNSLGIFSTKINFFANVNYRYVSSRQQFNNSQDYKFGNIWQSDVIFGRDFFLKNTLLSSSLGMQYRYYSADQINGFEAPNTGGMWSYFLVNQSISLLPNLQVSIGAELPAFRKVDGLQLTTSYRLIF